jgi:hypothetical protein
LTLYEDIYDLFLITIKDYQLDKLAATPTNLNNYVEGFLIRGLTHFTNCKQNLEDRNDNTQQFNITLTTKEKVILADLSVIEWLTSKILDVTQFQLHLNDMDKVCPLIQ